MKSLSAHQSQYLPWAPYFRKISKSDIFVVMDNVQFQRNGVQHRNKIRDHQRDFWLTVPLNGSSRERIDEKKIAHSNWRYEHWKSIEFCYGKAPQWKQHNENIYNVLNHDYEDLISLNNKLLFYFLKLLQIDTEIVFLSDLNIVSNKSQLILDICKQLDIDMYISGLGAKNYLDEKEFSNNGIIILYEESIPPTYEQFQGNFMPGLSILDFLFNENIEKIIKYME